MNTITVCCELILPLNFVPAAIVIGRSFTFRRFTDEEENSLVIAVLIALQFWTSLDLITYKFYSVELKKQSEEIYHYNTRNRRCLVTKKHCINAITVRNALRKVHKNVSVLKL